MKRIRCALLCTLPCLEFQAQMFLFPPLRRTYRCSLSEPFACDGYRWDPLADVSSGGSVSGGSMCWNILGDPNIIPQYGDGSIHSIPKKWLVGEDKNYTPSPIWPFIINILMTPLSWNELTWYKPSQIVGAHWVLLHYTNSLGMAMENHSVAFDDFPFQTFI